MQQTHILRIGEGKHVQTVRCRIVGPIGERDGVAYYNAILSPRPVLYRREGIHCIPMVPATNLKEIQKRDE